MNAETREHILYDGNCGICKKIVSVMESTLDRRGFDLAILQTEWVREKLQVDDEELLRDLLLIRTDGSVMRGAEAYRYAMKKIWWAWPAWLLSLIPGLRQLFDFTYRKIADNRHKISAAFGLASADGG